MAGYGIVATIPKERRSKPVRPLAPKPPPAPITEAEVQKCVDFYFDCMTVVDPKTGKLRRRPRPYRQVEDYADRLGLRREARREARRRLGLSAYPTDYEYRFPKRPRPAEAAAGLRYLQSKRSSQAQR